MKKYQKTVNDSPINTKIIETINKRPEIFTLVSYNGGYFGNLVYRAIASDDRYIWNKELSRSLEDLKPLEWPKTTEGFDIYRILDNYEHFEENHATTVHTGWLVLENMKSVKDLLMYYKSGKELVIKSHNKNTYKDIKCKTIRIYGNIPELLSMAPNLRFRWNTKEPIEPVSASHVYNLNINSFMSDNYDEFLDEYLRLCNFLDILPNINNLRAFILLHKERLKRFEQRNFTD